jgi:hypothetical protein
MATMQDPRFLDEVKRAQLEISPLVGRRAPGAVARTGDFPPAPDRAGAARRRPASATERERTVASIAKIRVRDSSDGRVSRYPSRQTPGPAIVLMYHRGGIDDFTKGVSMACLLRLSRRGSRCLSPVPECPADSGTQSPAQDVDIVVDVEATIDALRAHSDVVASVSSSWAIAWAEGWRCWLRQFARPCGAVVYYGGRDALMGEGVTVFEQLRNISCPHHRFFGNDDKNPSPARSTKSMPSSSAWHRA